jgi:hypothetical protein
VPDRARTAGPDLSQISLGPVKIIAVCCPDCGQDVWVTRTRKITHHSRTSTAGLPLNSCADCCTGAGKVIP